MIYLKPITLDNINDFKNTSYDNMTLEQKEEMITESINKIHNNQYFEFLVIYKNDVVIGFMNLFAHSKHIISCGPTIKDEFKCKGFGFEAEQLALKYAKDKGFTIAVGGVDDHMRIFVTDETKLDEVKRFVSEKTGLNHAAFTSVFIPEIPRNESGKVLYGELNL